MGRLFIIGLAFALAMCGLTKVGAQTNPGFNPNLQWCGTQGSVAIRGAANWQCLLPGTNGQALLSGGPGANPVWSTLTGTGTVTSVNGSGGSTGLTVSGGPITGAGTLTLGGTLAIASGGTGGTGSANTVFRSNGTANSFGQIVNGDITPGTITDSAINASAGIAVSKLASQPALTVIANATGSAAVPTTPTVTALLDAAFSNTQGSVLYRNVGGWSALPPGSAGTFLQTGGAGANPQWTAVSGASGGTVTSVTCNSGLTGGTFTVTGTCAIDTGNIPGIAGSGTAAAGKVGEVISSSVLSSSFITCPSNTPTTVTSITLTPGDWDISAKLLMQSTGSNTIFIYQASVSTTAANINISGNGDGYAGSGYSMTPVGSPLSLAITPFRVNLSSNTTYYISCNAASLDAAAAWGTLRARRMR